MATTAPANSFPSSAEAFQNPLPTVRQFHRQLQVALDEKNARLRTLVGGSYRQLLGTAETIVEMRRDIEVVESKLALVADGCGRTAIGKKVAGLGKLGLARDFRPGGQADLGWLARMKVLDGCMVVVGRLLKGKGAGAQDRGQSRCSRLVAAAKVLVLSRLLTKNLGDEAKAATNHLESAEELLADMRRKLGALRRRLLRSVERMIERIDGDREESIQALCAYSLATSSGAKDVLRHFLHVRGEAMVLAFEDEEQAPGKGTKEESMLRALSLYTKTLLDVQALVPRNLSDALLNLKRKPLLKDDMIEGLEGLRLDICERWLGDEIMFFTPYIRHDELDGSLAVEMLKSWAKKASEVFLRGFEKTLDRIVEFKTVVELRTKIYEAWISEGGKARGFDSSVMLDGLRKVVNDRLVDLIETRIAKLHLVGTEIEAVLESWSSITLNGKARIWNKELLEIELGGGAGYFKEAVISGVHGRNNSVSRVVKGYETWRHLIDELFTINDQLKSQRWDDNLESFEDDEVLERRITLLSKDDPQMLEDHVESSLEKAYNDLHQKIAAVLVSQQDSEYSVHMAIFTLRVLRDVRATLPNRPDLNSFGLSIIPTLHGTLATKVSSASMASFTNSASKQKRVVGRALWEGSPQLPIQPSPATFKFLYSLMSSMADAGSDLWSPTAVSVLKQHLREQLGQEWSMALESFNVEKTIRPNGYKQSDPGQPNSIETDSVLVEDLPAPHLSETQTQEVLIQWLFDMLILQQCLHTAGVERLDDGLNGLEQSLRSRIDLTSSSGKRLQQAAQEYWKRTSLLFGLLA